MRKELAEIQQKMAQVELGASTPTRENSALDALIREENWLAAELELYGDPPAATMRPFETFGPTPSPAEEDVPQETSEASQAPGNSAPGGPNG